jgi:hemoglobin/transferrin/lactoferrin receptor protein
VQSRNIAQARYWGIEAAAGLRSGGVDAYAVLNWTYGQERRSDGPTTPANRIPPLNGQLGVLVDAPWRLTLEPYVLFAARQDRLDDDDRNDTRIDPDGTGGWATLNLRIAGRASSWLWLQADGRNLLDKDYREHGSGVDAPGAGVVLSAIASLY